MACIAAASSSILAPPGACPAPLFTTKGSIHVFDGPHLGLAAAGSGRVLRARARLRREHTFPSRLFYQPPPFPPSGGGQGGPEGYPQQGGYPPFGTPAPGSGYGGYDAPQPGNPPGYPQYGPPSQGFPPGYPGYPPGYGGQPPTPPRRKINVGMIVGIVVGAILVACVGCVGLLYAAGQLANNLPVATATLSGPTPTPTPTVIYSDPLTAGATSMGGTQHCVVQSDGLHVRDNFACFVPAGTLTDLDVTVQVKQISGKTTAPYGIEVRRSSGGWYEFDIDGNSEYVIAKCVGSTCTTATTLVDFTKSAAINGGLNTTNTLKVRAVGSHFDFYVNSTKVGGADDATFSAGEVGLSSDTGIEVAYSNLKITKPQAQ
jgi:hypothetical protein